MLLLAINELGIVSRITYEARLKRSWTGGNAVMPPST